jgi:hypothetical protein
MVFCALTVQSTEGPLADGNTVTLRDKSQTFAIRLVYAVEIVIVSPTEQFW